MHVTAEYRLRQQVGLVVRVAEEAELALWRDRLQGGCGYDNDGIGGVDVGVAGVAVVVGAKGQVGGCLLYTSPSPRDS